jgi:hypothetical protein
LIQPSRAKHQTLVEVAHGEHGFSLAIDTFLETCLSCASATGMPKVTNQEEET